MSKRQDYETRTEEMILPILEEMHFELVDVEFVKEGGNWFLRAYIDKEGGITINDCEAVSRRMNDLLDEADFIEGSYSFEVSSPGLDRPLKKEKDYVRAMGKRIEIRTYRAIEKKKEFIGELVDYTDQTVTIRTDDERRMEFQKKEIALIRLAFEF